MTYSDIEKHWGTGEVRLIDVPIVNVTGHPTVKMNCEVCSAPLGDFIKAYFEHLQASRWRRRWDWRRVERSLREKLNAIQLEFYGEPKRP